MRQAFGRKGSLRFACSASRRISDQRISSTWSLVGAVVMILQGERVQNHQRTMQAPRIDFPRELPEGHKTRYGGSRSRPAAWHWRGMRSICRTSLAKPTGSLRYFAYFSSSVRVVSTGTICTLAVGYKFRKCSTNGISDEGRQLCKDGLQGR